MSRPRETPPPEVAKMDNSIAMESSPEILRGRLRDELAAKLPRTLDTTKPLFAGLQTSNPVLAIRVDRLSYRPGIDLEGYAEVFYGISDREGEEAHGGVTEIGGDVIVDMQDRVILQSNDRAAVLTLDPRKRRRFGAIATGHEILLVRTLRELGFNDSRESIQKRYYDWREEQGAQIAREILAAEDLSLEGSWHDDSGLEDEVFEKLSEGDYLFDDFIREVLEKEKVRD